MSSRLASRHLRLWVLAGFLFTLAAAVATPWLRLGQRVVPEPPRVICTRHGAVVDASLAASPEHRALAPVADRANAAPAGAGQGLECPACLPLGLPPVPVWLAPGLEFASDAPPARPISSPPILPPTLPPARGPPA